jgi:parallel beta-helix repeat protein
VGGTALLAGRPPGRSLATGVSGPPAARDGLDVRATSYPIPAGALLVAPWGADANDGAADRPVRTVARAVEAAPAGSTIVIRAGTYRESVPTFSKPLTLQPYPGETVWMKGSVVVTGWVADGATWRRDGWTATFCQTCYPPGGIDPAHPAAGLPDMVFVDGAPLAQVTSKAAVRPGTFFVDRAGAALSIGSDPTGRTVEASVHAVGLHMVTGARGTTVRGLGFAHYAAHANPGQGAVVGDTESLTFEHNTVAWSAGKGLVVYAPGAVVRGNTFAHNGVAGLDMWHADGAVVAGNHFLGNNRERFVVSGPVAEAAGAKITRSRRIVLEDNVSERNVGTGLWLDDSTADARVVRNLVRDNAHTGIDVEISTRAVVASNVVARNRTGISVNNASDVRVYNNTLSRNGVNLAVTDDERVNAEPAERALGITWVTARVTFVNNLLSGPAGAATPFLLVRDYNSSPLKPAEAMLATSDHNGFYRPRRSVPGPLVEWWRGTARALYASLAAYQAGTGRDRNSFIVEDTPLNPFFVDEADDDYALREASPARRRGTALPPDVAEAIGVPALASPDLGALLRPDGGTVTP